MIKSKFGFGLIIAGILGFCVFLSLLIVLRWDVVWFIVTMLSVVAMTWGVAFQCLDADEVVRNVVVWILTGICVISAVIVPICAPLAPGDEDLAPIKYYKKCEICHGLFNSEDDISDFRNIVQTGYCNSCWIKYT